MKHFLFPVLVSWLFSFAAWATDTPSDQAEAVKGNNAFAVELYKQLQGQSGNLFFSPESISTALAMTYAGARGETATEMASTMHFTLQPEKLHPAMGALLQGLNAAHGGYQLKVANALWGQEGYHFLPDFLKVTQADYSSGLNQMDFKDAADAACATINQWVEQQTENQIQNLIAPGAITKQTRLVLTNAIYFKGEWETPFKKEDTKDEDFHVSSTQSVKAPLMHLKGWFGYFDGGTFQALEIHYKNNELSMIVFLPKSVDGLADLEQSLTANDLQRWIGQMRPTSDVILSLPRFKMERQFSLGEMLAEMGMRRAFDQEKADFSGIASKEEMLKNGNLYIKDVFHKTFVEVDEQGTEAAAATALIVPSAVCAGCGPPPSPIFRADHPFLFLIRENRSGSILFLGRVYNPWL